MRLTICCWLFREGSSFSVLVSVWLGLPHIMCLEFRDEHPDIEREREKRRGRKRWVGRMRRSRSLGRKDDVVSVSFLMSYRVCSVSQPCPTLCDAMDCSPPGISIHGVSRQED